MAVPAAPTLSRVRDWDTGYLTEAAAGWSATARSWEDTFTGLVAEIGCPGGVPWEGAAAEAAQRRAHTDRMTVIGLADRLHGASAIARDGAQLIGAARETVLQTVGAAERAGFVVQEDFSVRAAPALPGIRTAVAVFLTAELRAAVGALVGTDRAVADRLTAATTGLGVPASLGGVGDGGPPLAPPAQPEAGIAAVDAGNRRLLDEMEGEYRALPEGPVKSDRLADIAAIRAALTVPDARLVFLARPADPAGMVGAATSVGDPFTAEHLAVAMPVAGATTRGAIAGMTRDAAELRAEAARIAAAAGMGETTAAIAYLGSAPIPAPEVFLDALGGGAGVRDDDVFVVTPPAGTTDRHTSFALAAELLGRPDLAVARP